MFYIAGPAHRGPALAGNTYLEGTYSEIYPDVSQDEAGLKKLFRQFSFPALGIGVFVRSRHPATCFGALARRGDPLFAAQQALSHRARLNRAARCGEYTDAMEKDMGAPSYIPRPTKIAA